MSKKTVAVIFGGRSPEHDVSVTSAAGILQNIDREKFNVVPVRISKSGVWTYLKNVEIPVSPDKLESDGPELFLRNPSDPGFLIYENGSLEKLDIDVVFPVLHGPFGEDGTIQGMLQMSGIPFVGAGTAGSAIGMDKVLMKEIFLQENLPAVDFMWFLRKSWIKNRSVIINAVEKEIGFPCFIKPANAGSSIGISKVKSKEDLDDAVEKAAMYDRKVLAEKAVNARELECAVLGNDYPEASVVGEIIPGNEFYDYDAKYQNKDSKTIAPADITEEVSKRVQALAKKAFSAIDCAGMARVDFLFDSEKNEIFLNEINTIPGFTPISMYPVLWEKTGISYTDLITKLIELAFERFEDLSRSIFV